MAIKISRTFRGLAGAAMILLPITFIMTNEITSAIRWDFYPATSSKIANLTKDKHLWNAKFYRGQQLIGNQNIVLPQQNYGWLPAGVTRIVLSTQIVPPLHARNDLAIHTGRIFARSFKIFINGHHQYDHTTVRFDTNIPLPNSDQITLAYDFDVTGISEPGFDLRSQILVGDRIKLSHISAEIQEKDHSLVLWLVIPRFIIGVLFALGSLIFAYGIEYQLFGLFSFLSGLKTAAHYGEMGLYIPTIVDHGALQNSLQLATIATLLIFLNYFFRKRHRLTNLIASMVAGLSFLNLLISSSSSHGSDLFIYIFNTSNILQQVACVYGAIIAWQTYTFLKVTKRSYPRQVISLILALTFVIALPILSYVGTSSNIFWLGGPLFELCFTLIVASCITTDIGGVRAERDSIRRKLGMFVDEGKVTDIINTRGASKEWRQNTTVMFIDMRNFCMMNEMFGPDEIFDAVNDYYQMVIETVYEHGGVVDKFIGDGVLAVWGIENKGTDKPEKQCVMAAIALRKRMQELNALRDKKGKFPFAIGIGIHSGRVTYGLIGNDERAEFTVIGSTVNIAARIEKQTKHVQSDILISRTSYNLLKDELIVCPRGLAPVVDDMNAMEVFQPIGIIDRGSVVFNDPLYEGLNLESKASVLENAPPNLLSINYTEYAYQARPEYKKA